jgi:hypothetical protein
VASIILHRRESALVRKLRIKDLLMIISISKRMPVEEFIKEHVEGLGYDYKLGPNIFKTLGSALKAVNNEGYEINIGNFPSLYFETVGLRDPIE